MEAIFSLECSPESLWEALLQKVFRFRDKEFKKIITTTYQRRHLGSYNAQQLRGMHDSYLMSRHWLKDLFCCLMSEHQWNFRLIKLKKKKTKTYSKNVLDVVNSFFTGFHHSPLNTISLGKSEIQDCLVAIFHHVNELRLFHLIKRLIACNDPACE